MNTDRRKWEHCSKQYGQKINDNDVCGLYIGSCLIKVKVYLESPPNLLICLWIEKLKQNKKFWLVAKPKIIAYFLPNLPYI